MRITLIISSLSAGGAEKVITTLANYWTVNNQDVILITLDSKENDFYSLDSRIKRTALGLLTNSKNIFERLTGNFKRIRHLRESIKNSGPEIIISFIDKTNILTILANAGLKYPLIICERVDPRKYHIGNFWQILRKLLYRLADALVVQTETAKLWSLNLVKKNKIYVIPNPVIVLKNKQENIKINKNILIAMGRLEFQKGFDILLKSFSKIVNKYPNWLLVIIGKGKEETFLKELAGKIGISKQVVFTGFVKEPCGYLQNADLFVMPSRFEGFPNALVEAMAYGLPVISFDCPSGPADIIRNGIDGLLVNPEDENALSGAMDDLMSDDKKRNQFSERATEVREKFNLEKIMGMWNQLIETVSQAGKTYEQRNI